MSGNKARTCLYLPEELMTRVSERAAKEGRSGSALAEIALESYLLQPVSSPAQDALARVKKNKPGGKA